MRARLATVATTALLVLGCGGLSGYGDEIATAPMTSGGPFELTYTYSGQEPHNLWLKYDLQFAALDWELTGPMSQSVGDEELDEWELHFTRDHGPIRGQTSRFTIGATESTHAGVGKCEGTTFLMELPTQPEGTELTIEGYVSGDADTTIKSLEFVVTN